MAREELKWQNIDADDLPAEVKKSFDAMIVSGPRAVLPAELAKIWQNSACRSFGYRR
jgi:hypothetical protein